MPRSILTAPAVFNKEFVISINGEAGLISSLNTPERIEKIPVFFKFFQKEVFSDLIRQFVLVGQSGPSVEMKGI